jgi:hypothetical protein
MASGEEGGGGKNALSMSIEERTEAESEGLEKIVFRGCVIHRASLQKLCGWVVEIRGGCRYYQHIPVVDPSLGGNHDNTL